MNIPYGYTDEGLYTGGLLATLEECPKCGEDMEGYCEECDTTCNDCESPCEGGGLCYRC